MKKILLILFLLSSLSASEFIIEDINSTGKQKSFAVIPYVFSSDATGLTGGFIGITHGYYQPQMTMFLTTFMGEKQDVVKNYPVNTKVEETQAQGFSLGIDSYRPSFSKRTFISLLGVYAYYPNQKLYLDGSHESVKKLDSDNPIYLTPLQTQGYNNWIEVNFKYVLAMGESKDSPLPHIKMEDGLAINREHIGGGVPFVTGQTVLGTRFFYTRWTTDMLAEEQEYNTNGMRIYLEHDNTDYPDNPSRGYNFMAMLSGDFGVGNSTQSWNALEFKYSHYIELDTFSWSKQNVLAFNTWSAYSPSWKRGQYLHEGGIIESHRTPMWEGARLGGWNRMRAYDSNRFSDKAAFYASAEYRVIPRYNPLKGMTWLPINIDWFQGVFFLEAGRVAPKYQLDTLLSDMKYDVGFSLRSLAATVPVRLEVATGEEGTNMWVMLKQPF